MPIMLISLVSKIDPNDVVDPTGVDMRAHSVATHDSLKHGKSVGSGSMEILLGVAAGKSVGSGSMESLLEVAAWKVCWKWHNGKSVGSSSMRSLLLE